jgi:KaiC/GvpD/RAD55 family RecA-like ATPase
MGKKELLDLDSNEIQANKRKPTPKKSFSLEDFKKKIGAQDIPSKPLEWIPIDDGLKRATGMPGIPRGYVTLFRGYSNTGKSTALMRAIVNAQKMGDFPIIIDTENNIDVNNKRLTNMGFDWNGDYLLINNKYLLDNYGIKQDKNRKEASIEDMGRAIYDFLDAQKNDVLSTNVFIAIDSIGTLNCIKTINALEKDESDNNMWNAGAYEKAFMSLLNNAIPNTRRVDSKYTTTLAAVQKIWYDSMNKVVKHKGGETFYFGARLIYHFGGIITHGTRRVTATSKGRDLNFGFENKVNIAKNHIDGEWGGISLEGKIISTPTGFIYGDKESENEYKKENILYFRNKFEDDNLSIEDIEFKSKAMDNDGNVSFEDEIIEKNTNFDNEND